MPLKQA